MGPSEINNISLHLHTYTWKYFIVKGFLIHEKLFLKSNFIKYLEDIDVYNISENREGDIQIHSNLLEKLSNIVTNVKQDRFPYLDHPGFIYHLRKIDSDGNYQIFSPSGKHFSESLLTYDMKAIIDHRRISYKKAFTKVVLE